VERSALRSGKILPARQQTEYDKSVRRWYLPKLTFWLSFSLEDTARRVSWLEKHIRHG